MSMQHRSKARKTKPNSKGLHPRNLHRQGYDFLALIESYPLLASYVKANAYDNLTIDFADSLAVKSLNTALLKYHYNIIGWDIPAQSLCPPIPGRVDYIHFIAELLGCVELTSAQVATPSKIKLLDIGTGANGVYPLLASQIYGWHCVGSDINSQSLENVAAIIANNSSLKDSVELRWQQDKNRIFDGIIQSGEYFDVSVCNPPFHSSQQEAVNSSQRKLTNLARNRGENILPSSKLNFGGLEAELWCKGGEKLFIKKLIKESRLFSNQCLWFTSLISKVDNVKPAKKLLKKLGASEVREIDMAQGNKITRILAWTFV
jgi:23S rRNA (adenine1618-N6)-methyltransferase